MAKPDITLKDIASSIDTLTAAAARGFQDVQTQIHGLDTKIDNVEKNLSERIGSVHHPVLMLQYDYGKIKTRLENVELKLFGSIQES